MWKIFKKLFIKEEVDTKEEVVNIKVAARSYREIYSHEGMTEEELKDAQKAMKCGYF